MSAKKSFADLLEDIDENLNKELERLDFCFYLLMHLQIILFIFLFIYLIFV